MSTRPDTDELRDEYDFKPEEMRRGERGKYVERYERGTDGVPLDPGSTVVPADGPTGG